MIRESLVTTERSFFDYLFRELKQGTKNKKKRSKYEKWLVHGSIPRWWFAGLNIPSLVWSYREREEKGETRKRKWSEKDKDGRSRMHVHIYTSKWEQEEIRKREKKKKKKCSRRREGRRDRLRNEKERQEVRLCYYRAPLWRTAQYGAISDFHPSKSRIYARAYTRFSWPAEGCRGCRLRRWRFSPRPSLTEL